ncbi:hypothetical protein PAPYR_8702 [Paratrimastix pyriformis]|uniref:ERCC4 domain-containing protein n=1 Tax=Paratrimastix pyriformis TaxID=342808 RepID=A0ABQ8UCJ8_9EUKA|nr:hypothetical protein PAPYR_8702 [Paratrimastix pyriformis]
MEQRPATPPRRRSSTAEDAAPPANTKSSKKRQRELATALSKKSRSRENCLPEIQVLFDPHFSGSTLGTAIFESLIDLGQIDTIVHPCAIGGSVEWRRKISAGSGEDDHYADEGDVLISMSPGDFCTRIQQNTLGQWHQECIRQKPAGRFSLAVQTIFSYLTTSACHTLCKKTASGKGPEVTKALDAFTVGEAITWLEMHGWTFFDYSGNGELVEHVQNITGAIAHRPYCHAEKPVVLRGPKSELTEKELWQRALEQLEGVSSPVAKVIADVFPSMPALVAALESRGPKSLEMVPYITKVGGMRRVGPALANRIAAYFTALDDVPMIHRGSSPSRTSPSRPVSPTSGADTPVVEDLRWDEENVT